MPTRALFNAYAIYTQSAFMQTITPNDFDADLCNDRVKLHWEKSEHWYIYEEIDINYDYEVLV